VLPVILGLLLVTATPTFRIVPREAERRVDVLVDGVPFTSYLWSEGFEKPVLWPLRTAGGAEITRGFPLDPRPGEATDHPHHVGLWFNHGDLDGVDYWGNSKTLRRKDPGRVVGQIVHQAIRSARRNELAVRAVWTRPDGKVALREETRFVFSAGEGRRAIDRIATLTAAGPATFKDHKEGLLALRLGPALEQRRAGPAGGTGEYRSSEGKVGDGVWGTRARWVMLTGRIGDEPVTVAILDHPNNPGYPTFWHTRGYGLFAANPLGQRVFSEGREALDLSLRKGQSVRFAYRVLVLSRRAAPEEIEAEHRVFVRRTPEPSPTRDGAARSRSGGL
jgi:hypothetical protein